MHRPVDRAMSEPRPEKAVMRGLWAECVEETADRPGDDLDPPLYLSLAGAEGRDIEALLAHGVIRQTETGAIAEEDLGKLVAVEATKEAALALKEKFFGLDVLDTPIENLLQMPSELAWPGKKVRRVLRARVVNLDFDKPLAVSIRQQQLQFPVIQLIEKLGTIHAQDPQVDWSVCLTLHAEFNFDEGVADRVVAFLTENFGREPTYADASRRVLGEDLFSELTTGSGSAAIADLASDDRQNFLMTLIPKRIVSDTHRQGWKVVTRRNLRYGHPPEHAPMVSWILDFQWDPRGSSEPEALYLESLATSIGNAELIDSNGAISLAA